ncbi:hypothetical protein OAF34_01340 [Pirellulaceae bacterium]|jgi:hypothetical protein|nr:hypothetical protein [Pirellulaceae bacterium]
MLISRWFAVCIFVSTFTGLLADHKFNLPPSTVGVIQKRYIDCHNRDTAESGIQLDGLVNMTQKERLAVLNKAQQQVYFGLIPPIDEGNPKTGQLVHHAA